jgi:hypothetical protein
MRDREHGGVADQRLGLSIYRIKTNRRDEGEKK